MTRPTLEQLADDLGSGRTTSRALVEASLAAIADPRLEGARTFIKVDSEGARAAADHIDGLRRRGRAPSRFAGIPFSVKDLFDLAGEVTTAGSRVLAGEAPATGDAAAIARLKAQGFVVLGRTNMTEFAYSGVGLNPHYGTPRSVFDRATGRIPGGSSSGAAVSVADGMCVLAIGTDTGGSCRIPAAYNGIVGYKPSHGRVPVTGVFPLSASLDSVGPLGNSARCCAIADAVMAGSDVAPGPARPLSGLRMAILRDYVLDGLDAAVSSAFDRSLKVLGEAGIALQDFRFAELAEIPLLYAKGGILGAEAFHVHRARLATSAAAYDPRVAQRMAFAAGVSAADYLDYLKRRRELVALFGERCAGYDAVVLPTVLNVAPPIAALADDKDYFRYNAMSLRNTAVGNFLNGCAISLPMQRPEEPPSGLMLLAPWGRDQALLALATQVEELLATSFS